MDARELIRQHLSSGRIMQLATTDGTTPWACNIHYYADDDLNIYWISTETREHSKHIALNQNVAGVLMVHEDTPEEPYVIGVSIAGEAKLMPEIVDEIGRAYTEKTGKSPEFFAQLTSGDNPHRFYRLKPSKFVLFDTKNFPQEPRQEVSL